jgi:hypothetical protein
MNSVFFDPALDDDERRNLLYSGQLFVYAPTPGAKKLVAFARQMVEDAFRGRDPELAQHDMPVEEYATLLTDLKPRFIHHPTSKQCIQEILAEVGCDPEQTYFDVPRMRTSTSENYLTSGIAYAFHPHRDTWYSAPMCQINWWLPIYPILPSNAMAFHPAYWNRPVKNGSRIYNYEEWNRTSRLEAAKHVKTDTRVQPKPEEPMELDPQLRLLPAPGGMILFAGAQMHSSVPNDSGRTRFSIDFRTVHLGDVKARRGAPNIDSECTGTTMRDYLRVSDLAHIPEDVCVSYEPGTPLVGASAPADVLVGAA